MRTRSWLTNRKVWGLLLLVALLALPFVGTSKFLLSMMISVFILAVYGMSYDLLLGYTGIVSFGHAIFFGTGAYAVGILLTKVKNPDLLPVALLIGVAIAAVTAFVIGLLSLRVKDVYFSMITLAFAELFFIFADKFSELTGGSDGIPYVRVPAIFNDRTTFYFLALAFLVLVYLILHRIVHSPLGRTLQAIRENEQRAQSLGYNVLRYKLASLVISGIVAALAGGMWAVLQKYVNTSVLSLDQTISALLMTIIGGVGTLFGAVLGAGVITFAQEWLSQAFDRWFLIFGVLYVLIVMFFPKGILGTIRDKWTGKRQGGAQNGVSSDQRGRSVS